MAYKFTKGSQVMGDIKAADDTQRDTLIDFGEDQIDFQTSGSVRLQITNNGVEALNGAFTGSLNGTASVAVSDQIGNTIVGGIYHVDHGLFQNPPTGYTRVYFPFDDTFTERVGPSTVNYNIAPFAGEIVKVVVKSNADYGSTNLTCSFHKGNATAAYYSSTPTTEIGAAGQKAYATHVFDFMGEGATFSEGEIIGFGLKVVGDFSGSGENVTYTTVVRYDPYAV